MKVLILGASGATGKLVVSQLIKREINIRIVIRKNAILSDNILNNKLVEIVYGNIAELNPIENKNLIEGCDAVVCCLGHNITFKGLFGKPRLLVYTSIKNVCEAIIHYSPKKMKIILMNTVAVANENKDVNENRSLSEKIVLSILGVLLPPQKDNVSAANYLLRVIGKDNEKIGWTAVRPDSLIDDDEVKPYEVFETIKRSPLFNPGKTSRINVGHFMAELITNDELWQKWKNKMPVIYNK
ncbi:MAG: SDR family oxidoreductase [bacterium]|nr:SDR family oxidoreductase [bacterium]